jgi:hypothetical protein
MFHEEGRFTAAPYVQIYFPKDQTAELAGALTTEVT